MKKILSLILVLCMALTLVACGGASGGEGGGQATEPKAQFKAGFGVVDITPKDPVPLDSYGDARNRMSDGYSSLIEARAVAVQDENGELLIFITVDTTWANNGIGKEVRNNLSQELGIEPTHVVMSGTHTHSSVACGLKDIPSVSAFNKKAVEGMTKAALDAVADLKPAEVYVGSAYTENLNFVRLYYMDDGSVTGDNFPGTGKTVVSHVTEADNELQLMKFVREGGKDILIAQYQTHPHLEGKTNTLSAQLVGNYRDVIEDKMDVHCLGWNGAAGNINSKSRLQGETRTEDPKVWAEYLYGYTKEVYDDLTRVETGPIKVADYSYMATVDHSRDYLLAEAKAVKEYADAGHTSQESKAYAEQLGFRSTQQASRIIACAGMPETQEIYLYAWSFGDVSGVVLPYELFCESGMQMKEGSPFEKTFITGYSWPSYTCYIPTESTFVHGSYEVDNCSFVAGTAEEMVSHYLTLLESMHE